MELPFSYIDFDDKGNATVQINNCVSSFSFLDNFICDNSRDKILEDYNMTNETGRKEFLKKVLTWLDKLDTKDKEYCENCVDEEPKLNSWQLSHQLEIGWDEWSNEAMITVHKVTSKHSGWWYVFGHIEEEIKILIECIHIYRGFMRIRKNIDEYISALRNARSFRDIVEELSGKWNLDETQLLASYELSLSELTGLDEDILAQRIESCKAYINFLENL